MSESEHSNHQELVLALESWFNEDITMGEMAALTQAQVKRIESAQRYFDTMLVAEARHPLRLERAASEARETLAVYLTPLKKILGHVLSFEPDGARLVVPTLVATHRDMKKAYQHLQDIEQELAASSRTGDEPTIGIVELGTMARDYLRGKVPASELQSAIQALRTYVVACHQTLAERLADLEQQEGVDLLLQAATDARRGYEIAYNTLMTMEQCIEHDNPDLMRCCLQDLVETAELLKRARAWADDATEEGWLNWQESYNFEYDVWNQPAA